METERKKKLALETLAGLCDHKAQHRAYGKLIIEIVFQDGYAKFLEVTDKTTVADRPAD